MTREEMNKKLKNLITYMKCEVSGKVCDDNCPYQYDAGNMGEIVENLEAISKLLEREPCGDCISRQAAQSKIKSICDEYRLSYEDGERKGGFTGGSAYALGHAFDDLPPVTPQQKTGYWIAITKDEKSAVCSCCNLNNFLFGDYCKWCGAKNDFFKVQESEE